MNETTLTGEQTVAAIEAGLASSHTREVAEHLLSTGRINETSTLADGIAAVREYYAPSSLPAQANEQ